MPVKSQGIWFIILLNFLNFTEAGVTTTTTVTTSGPGRTGHESLDFLYTYEHINPAQDSADARILSSSTTLSYSSAKENTDHLTTEQVFPTPYADDHFVSSLPAQTI
jgi:hypothetical protein